MEIEYHRRGDGEQVCVAISGGPGVHWEYLRMPLIERRATVVYAEPADGTRDEHAAALDRLLDRLGHDRVHLLGHGHGGLIAQHYALRRPERLAGLVLYNSAPVTGPEQDAETARRLEDFARRDLNVAQVAAVLAELRGFAPLHDDARLRAIAPTFFANYWSRGQELASLRAVLRLTGMPQHEQINDRAVLPGLRVPTLVVAGRGSLAGGPRWARELHELIPYAQLQILWLSGGLGHLEEPERFAGAVFDLMTTARILRREPVAPLRDRHVFTAGSLAA